MSTADTTARRRGNALLVGASALAGLGSLASAHAQELPTGGSVAAGDVVIGNPADTQLFITQSSSSAVVNWDTFSIGAGNSVVIEQPFSNAALLNRVTGSAPSTIAGQIIANGQVYLVNPNGIAITETGVVDIGSGFVASTLGISDDDFLDGSRVFSGGGASAGVSNAGVIRIGRGGYAALVGGTISNSGVIVVPLGRVGLGSGELVFLDFSGDGFLQVAVPTMASSDGPLIDLPGYIAADGGSVIIDAATARGAARYAVNISGVVEARTIGGQSGSIVIGGGEGGEVVVSGQLSAAADAAMGGDVVVTGQIITLRGSSIDVSGAAGGGNVNIGGGRRGEGALAHADTVDIDADTTIRADATNVGDGGEVVVWSGLQTTFAGTITARGGAEGGDGGEAEVSGHARLDYIGFTDLSAANGRFGTLLLDPYNVIISNGANNTGGSFTANTNDSIINASTLEAALGAANVTISTGAGGSQAGDITVSAPLTWSAGTTLTLDAYHSIAVNADIIVAGNAGGLSLITNNGGAGGVLSFGDGASASFTGTPNAGQSLAINGVNYTLIYTQSQLDAIDGIDAVAGGAVTSYGAGLGGNYALAIDLDATGTVYTRALVGEPGYFTGRLDGLGHVINDLNINAPNTDYVGLVGRLYLGSVSNIGLVDADIRGRNVVGGLVAYNVQAAVSRAHASGAVSGSNYVGGLVGFAEGYGAVIDSSANVSVSGSNSFVGGLLGFMQSYASVTGSQANGPVSGSTYVGGLVGDASFNSSIVQSHATGDVTGTAIVGGLAGIGYGSIADSYATGAVAGGDYSGGLVGYISASSTIDRSHASGDVTGTVYVGGLVGLLYQGGAINGSFASGDVSGNTYVGGLAGGTYNGGLLFQSYATGDVSGLYGVGGLVGINNTSGLISETFATGAVGGTDAAGGLVGLNYGSVGDSHAFGAVAGANMTGGVVGYNNGAVDSVYATGAVSSAGAMGGLVGVNDASGVVTNAFWDVQTSGLAIGVGSGSPAGVVGLTTAQLQGMAPLPNGVTLSLGSEFSGGSAGGQSGLYPFLSGIFPGGVQVVAGFAFTDGGVTLLSSPSGTIVYGSQPAPGLVSVSASGANFGAATTGANGYYYVFAPAGTVAANGGVVAYTQTDSGAQSSGAQDGTSFAQMPGPGVLANLNIYGGWRIDQVGTGLGTLSSLESAYSAAIGTTAPSSFLLANRRLNFSGSPFTIDQLLSAPGTLILSGNSAVNQSGAGAINTPNLLLLGAGGRYTLDGANNHVGLLAADTDVVSFVGADSLTIGSVAGVNGVTANGAVTLVTSGDLTIAPGAAIAGQDPVLAASGAFINNAGANAVIATSGRWLIYSGMPSANTFGNLDSANTALWGATFASLTPGAISQLGNRYVFAWQPTLTFTSTDTTRVYGEDISALLGGHFTVTGFESGITGAYLGDTEATAFGGAPLISSTGASANAGVAGGPYVMDIAAGNLQSASGYGFAFASSGALTVTPAPITVTALGGTSVYGSSPLNPGLSATGLQNGESVNVLAGLSNSFGITSNSGVAGGPYTLSVDGILSNQNYTITIRNDGAWVITPAALSLTALNASHVYGASLSFDGDEFISSGLVNGETIGSVTLTSTGAGATANVAGGPYAINISDPVGGTFDAANYTISYNTGALTVTPAPITVTALGGTSVYGSSPLNPGLSATGLQNGESVNVLTGLFNSFGITSNSGVAGGPYTLSVEGILSNPNYTITLRNDGAWVITPASITVFADQQTRWVGGANPALTYQIVGQLFGGDSIGGALTTAAVGDSPAGVYAITQGTLSVSPNYTLTYVGANLTILAPVGPPLVGSAVPFWASDIVRDGIAPGFAFAPSVPLFIGSEETDGFWEDPNFDGNLVCIESGSGVAATCLTVR